MSSYILILLISAFINICPYFPSLGHYFLAFLQYYGHTFQSDHMFIVEGEYIMYQEEYLPGSIAVMDLFNPSQNAAAAVTKLKEIRELFKKIYEEIKQGNMEEIKWKV